MTEIVRYNLAPLAEVMQLGEVFAKSGMFKDTREANQAIVKILAGRELGFEAVASMMGIHFVQGRVTVGANLIAARIKSTKGYDYLVGWIPSESGGVYGCEITILRNGKEVGVSTFDYQDAVKASLISKDNYKNYPRNMYFSRAISNAVRWYCPEVFNGATVYTPDELGATVDEEGNIVEGATTPVPQQLPAPQPTPTAAVPTTQITPKSMPKMKPSTWELLNALGLKRFGDEWEKGDRQKKVAAYVSDNQTDDIMSLLESEAQAAIEEIEKKLAEMKAAAEAEPAPA